MNEDSELIHTKVIDARRLGYAYAPQGLMHGTSAVSMPIKNSLGAALGAITISTMAARLENKRLETAISLMRKQSDLITKQYFIK